MGEMEGDGTAGRIIVSLFASMESGPEAMSPKRCCIRFDSHHRVKRRSFLVITPKSLTPTQP